MVVNGRVHVLLEFMCSYPWYQPGGTNGADRKEAGRGLGHRCLTGWFALAECSDHMPVGGYVSTNREYCSSPGGFTRRDTGDRWNYADCRTKFCAASYPQEL